MLKKLFTLVIVIVALIILINNVQAGADTGTRVQRGSLNLSAVQQNVTIDSVNVSRSFVISSSRSSASSDGRTLKVMNVLLNDTTIGFYKLTALESTNVEWELIEDLDLSVQRGTFDYTTQLNINQTVNPVNISNTFIIASNTLDIASSAINRGFWRAEFLNTTNAAFTRRTGTTGGTVSWQVISWEGATVQNGSINLVTTTNSSSDNINEVNLSNTFLVASNDCNTNVANICFAKTYFYNSTRVISDRVNNTVGTDTIDYFVISAPTISVQNNETALNAVVNVNQTILPVNISRSFLTDTWTSDVTGATYNRGFATYKISNSTSLTFQKDAPLQGTFHKEYVITFQDAPTSNGCTYSGIGAWSLPCGCNVTTNVNLFTFQLGNPNQNLIINGTGTTIISANITNVANVTKFGIDSNNKCTIIRINGGGWQH